MAYNFFNFTFYLYYKPWRMNTSHFETCTPMIIIELVIYCGFKPKLQDIHFVFVQLVSCPSILMSPSSYLIFYIHNFRSHQLRQHYLQTLCTKTLHLEVLITSSFLNKSASLLTSSFVTSSLYQIR